MYSAERINEKAAIESGIDTDWYLLDDNFQIAIVASAGGLLPESVSSDLPRLERTIKYFRALPVLSNEITLTDDVCKLIAGYNQQQKDTYLKDVHYMTSRGFYYFDKVVVNAYDDFRYFLKAKPAKPLIIDREDNAIKELLSFPRLKGEFENLIQFMVNGIE
ncbi:hypothetical protein HGH93_30775 [Chitinophaga polysaccharea]|uniref:hypothetical protein n=1 Tax=Chitinophaga polysaccharea TaxID=1293035 RepID=UPI0014555AF9|nr:hypothetical protein [Chitinophaga polysaccharea]NLR62516.1 hypothetical protein [Chitinophaga polysaccharea]